MSNGQALQLSDHDRLVLTTLGRTSLERVSDSGSRHELLSAGKPLGLVVYLACSPGRSASREHLMDLLWADLDLEAARHSVRQAVWFLRQRLGDHAIAASSGSVELCVPLESDRDAFLEAIERVEFERALDLYGGDFLPGFAAPGGADFEQWADLERFRLRRMFRRAGETVVRDWMTRGRLRKAKDLAVRLRTTDPDDESGWRLELETLLAANDRVGAELAARHLEEVLARAERPPEPTTAGLLALVRQAAPEDPPAAPKQPLTTELIGREREFAAILAAWGAARDGMGQHLHITGAAGLGKTRLLADVHARLRSMGGRVVVVRANPGERSVPYALASELALALAQLPGAAAVSPDSAAALVALNPTLSSCYGAAPDHAFDLEALRRRTIALAELLRAVAEEHPVALLIDDVHWTDEASRQILNRLLSQALKHAVLVVTAARPGIPGVVGRVSVEPFALEPLTVDMIGVLLASLGRLPAEPWATRFPGALHTSTAGTPLLILETLNLLLEQGTLTLTDGAWSCRDGAELDAILAQGWPLRRRLAALSRRESWLLVLLATAGAPLPADVLARAAGRDREAVQADLQGLDVRGLVARDGSEWQPAHDEIAARALEGATPGARRAANASLGHLLVATGRDDPGILQRAGRHLAAAGEDQELTRVFRRRLLLQRRRGERRSARTLAAALLGEGATPAQISRLVRSLPTYIRLGLVTPRRIAAAGLAVVAVAAGAAAIALRPIPPAPDAWLVLVRQLPADSLSAREIPIRREGWEDGSTLDGDRFGRPLPALSVVSDRHDVTPTMGGSAWAYGRTVRDSGDIDLFMVDTTGVERRLTAARGDDRAGTWSPDGRLLVIATSRWSPSRYNDLAVLDPRTGVLTRLTFDSGASAPMWSPDGTRIAFFYERRGVSQQNSNADELCWINADGLGRECFALEERPLLAMLGWYDSRQLLILVDTGGPAVARFDLETRELHVIARDINGPTEVSPDGRWLACYCQQSGTSVQAWYVFPTDRPDLQRRLLLRGGETDGLLLRWLTPRANRAYLDRVRIVAPDTIPIHVAFRLRAAGLDPAGADVRVPRLAWRSLDTTVATVEEPTGVVRPRRLGVVTIRVSAGGWRYAERRLVVGATWSHTVLTEDWRQGIAPGWIVYGEPSPTVETDAAGRPSFWNQGDGWDESGAYSRSSFIASRGLGVEAWWSSPVNGPRQQFLYLTLSPWLDSTRISRWNHRTGSAPIATGCWVRIPQTDGKPRRPAFVDGDDRNNLFVPAPDWVLSGRWYRVRVQLFPDGRCGYAFDGRAMAAGREAMPLAVPYRVALHGNSLDNHMLVGPVEIWEGVRDDVDWSALDEPRSPLATSPPAPSPPSSRLGASPTGSPHTGPSRRIPRRPR